MWIYAYNTSDCTGKAIESYSFDCNTADSFCSCNGSPCDSVEVDVTTCGNMSGVSLHEDVYLVVDECLLTDNASTIYTCDGDHAVTAKSFNTADCTGSSSSLTLSSSSCIDGFTYQVGKCTNTHTDIPSTTPGTGTGKNAKSAPRQWEISFSFILLAALYAFRLLC